MWKRSCPIAAGIERILETHSKYVVRIFKSLKYKENMLQFYYNSMMNSIGILTHDLKQITDFLFQYFKYRWFSRSLIKRLLRLAVNLFAI